MCGENGAGNIGCIQCDHAVAEGGGTGIQNPKSVDLLAVGDVGMTKEEDVRVGFPGGGDGPAVAPLDVPEVAVGEEYFMALQSDQADGGIGGPAVAVAGDGDHGLLGIGVAQLLRVGGQVAQVDDQVWLFPVNGVHHTAPGAVGVRKNKNFQIGHLISFFAYTGINRGEPRSGFRNDVRSDSMKAKGMDPAELSKHGDELKKLAYSGDAQRLMELLRQGGGVQDAAQAAAKGDPSALMGMMQRLMSTQEGAQLVERLGQKAKESGLTE